MIVNNSPWDTKQKLNVYMLINVDYH
jgi:hypothetical protein